MVESKEDIRTALAQLKDRGLSIIGQRDEVNLSKKENSKWSPIEEFYHLIQANKAIAKGLATNHFMIKMLGTPNRATRSYAELTSRYEKKLAQASIGTNPYAPELGRTLSKSEIENDWNESLDILDSEFHKWSEEDLDGFLLPHPLMGRMIVREMMFFAVHHTTRHLESIENKLSI